MADRMTDERDPHRDQIIAEAMRQEELRQKREAYFAEKEREAEAEDRRQKQAALKAHLDARAQRHLDYTGAAPSVSLIESWQQAYLDAREAEAQAERAEKLAQINAEHYDRLH